MKITLSLKAIILGFFLTLLFGCQSAPKGLTPEQVAVLKEQGFKLNDEGWTLNLSNRVLFAYNVGELNQETRQVVEKLGKTLLGVGLDKVRIDGHTDSAGDAVYNQKLSLQRAQSVADALVNVGMKPTNLDVRGRGETAPIADNKTEEGRAENRRVAVVIANQ